MDIILQPFSLRTMSYWKVLDIELGRQLVNCPALIRKAIDHDIKQLKILTATYVMLPEWTCRDGLLSRNLQKIRFNHLGGTKFMCNELGDLIHEKSIDNSDYFKLGVSKFLSQVYENTIEQDTMISKEIIHFDSNTLYVMSDDHRFGLLNDSDTGEKLTHNVVMTFKECNFNNKECLVVTYDKVQNQNKDDASVVKDTAIYCEQ